jgi:hypothetical protein
MGVGWKIRGVWGREMKKNRKVLVLSGEKKNGWKNKWEYSMISGT